MTFRNLFSNMTKVVISILFALLISLHSTGQGNLVYNSGFEQTFQCPSDSSVIRTTYWFTPDCGTPDFYYYSNVSNMVCAEQYPATWGGGVYLNNYGYTLPNSGLGYSGILSMAGGELMAGKLVDSLTLGRTYSVSFYVSLSELYFNQGGKGLDLIGLCFMNDSITDYSSSCWQYLGTLNVTAGNQSGNFLTDTASWMLVRDTFVANGGERFFVVGNIDTANTQYFNSQTPTPCYYYFDDFDVHCIDCTSDTSEPPVYPEITITPTLTQGELLLTGEFPSGTKFEVYDVLGQLVFYDELQSGNQNQSVFLPLGAGVYTCRVMAEGSLLKAEKVVVVK
jgi:hypothetical protein